MDDETEGTQNIQNEKAFNDQMPLYPDNYDVKRTVRLIFAFYEPITLSLPANYRCNFAE